LQGGVQVEVEVEVEVQLSTNSHILGVNFSGKSTLKLLTRFFPRQVNTETVNALFPEWVEVEVEVQVEVEVEVEVQVEVESKKTRCRCERYHSESEPRKCISSSL
jgi:ABC-type molybdenum transport system ATPase subunit/photorepair protein PhrA